MPIDTEGVRGILFDFQRSTEEKRLRTPALLVVTRESKELLIPDLACKKKSEDLELIYKIQLISFNLYNKTR